MVRIGGLNRVAPPSTRTSISRVPWADTVVAHVARTVVAAATRHASDLMFPCLIFVNLLRLVRAPRTSEFTNESTDAAVWLSHGKQPRLQEDAADRPGVVTGRQSTLSRG